MISQVNNLEVAQQFNKKHNNKKYWSKDEDTKLNSAVIIQGSNWKVVAEYLPGRNASQCAQRWKRIKPKEDERNQKWNNEEDQELLKLTKNYSYNWRLIANYLPNRTRRQIRERYVNHLDPNIIKTPWTEDEDKWIWQMYQTIGTKWSDMSKRLSGRPENMIKNRFYSHIRKQYGKIQNPYYVVPNNVRVLEKDLLKKNKQIKKINKFRKYCQKKKYQEVKQNKEQLQVNLEKKIEEEQQQINNYLSNQIQQQQQQYYQTFFPCIPQEYLDLQQPQVFYPYQHTQMGYEFYGHMNPIDQFNCQKELINQSIFLDILKSQINDTQIQMFGNKQIQFEQIIAKEEEDIDNTKFQNKILVDKSCRLQIRVDIIEEIQKRNQEVQFKQ